MPVHQDVLRAARATCGSDHRFRLVEVVEVLSHLNKQTVRTHISSRCCVNAPKNHPHKWNYFRRVGRGVYEILPEYQKAADRERVLTDDVPRRSTIHAVVVRDGSTYVAECLELAVVTQSSDIDSLLKNLREAIALHLEGEDRQALGLTDNLTLAFTAELSLANA